MIWEKYTWNIHLPVLEYHVTRFAYCGVGELISEHADVVGSLLRPALLLTAQKQLAAGVIDQAAFRSVEDCSVDGAVRLQEEAGLGIVTDGEMRRRSFQSQLPEAVDGFGEIGMDAFLWGQWYGDQSAGDWNLPRPSNIGVIKKLSSMRFLSVDEFTYLRARTVRTPKITLPSPSLFANFWSPQRSRDFYPTLDSFLADVVDILRAEVAELARLGASYIQLDAPHYCLLLDSRTRRFYESQGWKIDEWLERGLDMDNAVIGRVPNVTFGFHL
jgi:5-methyltetrahydropteroyltriglutamate--homocysteine methyltransferase